jgi:HSP20 family molecular chaperone IbpA
MNNGDQSQTPPSGDVPARAPAESPPRWFCTPPIDIYDTEAGLVLRADLPGVTPDNLELQVEDNRLTLLGKVTPPVPEDARLIYQEYRVGDFLRSFILSDDVDHERITAKLSDGVLEVTLPRAASSPPRRIQIQSP